MKKTFLSIQRNIIICSAISLLITFSCKKDQEESDLGSLNKSVLITETILDTFDISARTISIDSFPTYKAIQGLVGDFIDPVFGHTKASFATQIRLSNSNVDFQTESLVSLDSMVLELGIDGKYGNPESVQNIQIFELTEELDPEKEYQYFDQIAYNESAIGNAFLQPDNDTVLKIKLNLEYAAKILYANPEYLISNTEFKTYIKGLLISSTPIAGNGSIAYINLFSNSKVTLYYKNKNSAGVIVNIDYELLINTQCTNFNQFYHDYSSSELNGKIDDTTTVYSNIYLQSMAGSKAILNLPDLSSLNDGGNVIINRADLILEAETSLTDIYSLSTQLFVIINGSTPISDPILIPDFYISESRFGGDLYNTNFYKFNITSYCQNSLLNNLQKDLQLYVSRQMGNKADRVVLKNNIKLIIGYTKL